MQAPLTGSQVGHALFGSQANAGSVHGSPGVQKKLTTQMRGVPGGASGRSSGRQLPHPLPQEQLPPQPSSPQVVPSHWGVQIGKRCGPGNPRLAASASFAVTTAPVKAPAPRPSMAFKTVRRFAPSARERATESNR
jgi:hypothetical protein